MYSLMVDLIFNLSQEYRELYNQKIINSTTPLIFRKTSKIFSGIYYAWETKKFKLLCTDGRLSRQSRHVLCKLCFFKV